MKYHLNKLLLTILQRLKKDQIKEDTIKTSKHFKL